MLAFRCRTGQLTHLTGVLAGLAISGCGLTSSEGDGPGVSAGEDNATSEPPPTHAPLDDDHDEPGEGSLPLDSDPSPPEPAPPALEVCVPGESLCDPEQGRIIQCTEDGQRGAPELDAPLCARSLTTDREGGFICAIWGRDDLRCMGSWPLLETYSLDFDADEVAIVDDGRALMWSADYCGLSREGRVACNDTLDVGGVDLSLLTGCTKIVVNDQPTPHVCALCESEIHCARELPRGDFWPEAAVIDFDSTDGTLFWLSSDGVYSSYSEEPVLAGTFSALTLDHEQNFCVRTNDDHAGCYFEGTFAESSQKYAEVRPGAAPYAMGLTASGAVDLLVQEGESLALQQRHEGPFIQISGTLTARCALSGAGEVRCWNDEGEETELNWGFSCDPNGDVLCP